MSESAPQDHLARPPAPQRQLTLFDSTCIIVGIIIGAGIYRSSPQIAACLPGPGWLIGMWLLGGLIALVGALCYSELITTYPKSGGDYVYLNRAYGRSAGFLFAWAELWVIRPGSIGSIAYVLAEYANQLWPLATGEQTHLALMGYASASVLLLTGINVLGVRQGKWTQNSLTVVKVLGLMIIFAAGFLFAPSEMPRGEAAAVAKDPNFRLAMIFILWTYGGWSEMGCVGAEVRNPSKNILRALVSGTLAVTLIYVLVNLAFVYALGFDGLQNSTAVASDVLRLGWGDRGAVLISLLICISALGAINGQIFTGARIFYAMGTDHRLYARLGRWHPRWGTPVWSLLVQALITLGLVVGFGLTRNGFESMVEFTAAIYWIFALLVGFSIFVLRYREPDTPRPFRVPFYPLSPLIFCLFCLFMLYSSLSYAIGSASHEPIWAVAIVLLGVVLSFFNPKEKTP